MSRLSWKVWQRLRACVGVCRTPVSLTWSRRGVFGSRIARPTTTEHMPRRLRWRRHDGPVEVERWEMKKWDMAWSGCTASNSVARRDRGTEEGGRQAVRYAVQYARQCDDDARLRDSETHHPCRSQWAIKAHQCWGYGGGREGGTYGRYSAVLQQQSTDDRGVLLQAHGRRGGPSVSMAWHGIRTGYAETQTETTTTYLPTTATTSIRTTSVPPSSQPCTNHEPLKV